MKRSEGGAHGGGVRIVPTTILTLVLAALVAINLLYFLSNHTRITNKMNSQYSADTGCKHVALGNAGLGTAPTENVASLGADGGGDDGVVRYLKRVVFADTVHVQRTPMEGYWLPQPGATDPAVAEYRNRVATYLKSAEFKRRWDALRAQTDNERGIVISAGGRYYLPQAVVLLRMLRHNLHSTLPVEIVWHGDEEMDNTTFAALKAEFAPLRGYDATKVPHPAHHRPGAKLKGFPMKPFALLHSSFKQALLLDCDMVLRKDPRYIFDDALFKERGNLLWGDIYGAGMFRDDVFDFLGINRSVRGVLDAGKGDFNRYAESGQVLIDRAMHLDMLEWTWFLNSFSDKGGVYDFMYGDKDTYGVGFAMAGKAHLYTHVNVPPGGVFTHVRNLGWQPREEQTQKQGGWWLQGLVHYDTSGEVLLIHRVTGEVHVDTGHAPTDEIITPPLPHSWSMWYMGYAPSNSLQRSIDVHPLNMTYLLGVATPGQACPLAAWSAYWTLRTHGIPTERHYALEARCKSALDAEYGSAGAEMIRRAGLLERPLRLAINAEWEKQVDGGWNAPKEPLWGVPLNMTGAGVMWRNLDEAVGWANVWMKRESTLQRRHRHMARYRRRARRARVLLAHAA